MAFAHAPSPGEFESVGNESCSSGPSRLTTCAEKDTSERDDRPSEIPQLHAALELVAIVHGFPHSLVLDLHLPSLALFLSRHKLIILAIFV